MSDWSLYDRYVEFNSEPVFYRLSLIILSSNIALSTIIFILPFIFADFVGKILMTSIFVFWWLIVIGLVKKSRLAHIVIGMYTIGFVYYYILYPQFILFNPLMSITVLIWTFTFILNPKVYQMVWRKGKRLSEPTVASKSRIIRLDD
jgi:hypothetical protein